MSDGDEPHWPGWEAIEEATEQVYGDRAAAAHFPMPLSSLLGAPTALDDVAVYEHAGAVPHWHYVSYGLTELYEKASEDEAQSGAGFELTLRVPRGANALPPAWPARLLRRLAGYVKRSGNAFAHGDVSDLGEAIASEAETGLPGGTHLTCCLLVRDPELPDTSSPHGNFSFLQVVGLTADEYAAVRLWNGVSFAGALGRVSPLYLTDLQRPPLLTTPAFAAEVAEGTARDGSSFGSVYAQTCHWHRTSQSEPVRLVIDDFSMGDFLPLFHGRLAHGRPLRLLGPAPEHRTVRMVAAASAAVSDGETLEVAMPPLTVEELLARVQPRPGVYRLAALPQLEFEVIGRG